MLNRERPILMKNALITHLTLLIAASTLLMPATLIAAPTAANVQPPNKVKVHKDLISIAPPDQNGLVLVTGQPGAIEATSNANLRIVNLTTKLIVTSLPNKDGSFQARISAAPVDQVRVYARNQQGKRSYGTFSVPAVASSTPVTHTGPNNIAVVVMVIDTTTGRIVATRQIAGTVPKTDAPYDHIAYNITSKCAATVESILQIRTEQPPPSPTDPNSHKPLEITDPNHQNK